MLTPDQEKLKEAALAATPGPWIKDTWSAAVTDLNETMQIYDEGGHSDDDAAFIAAANPAAILAILAQLEQVQGWQPIETAPKDGTSILLYTPEGQIEACWQYGDWEQSPCYATYDGAGGVALNCQPTHWRTLSPPPEAA